MGICFICGIEAITRKHHVVLWVYGNRTNQIKDMCKTCCDLEEKGEL